MARIGKIARLPGDIRSQLNSRLHEGLEGKSLLVWLNALPQVQEILAQSFDHRPVTEQNLSDWRQGGYQDWLAREDVLAHARAMAAGRHELQTLAPGQSFADHLAAAVGFQMAAVLAAHGSQLNDDALGQLRSLSHTCQAVAKLRRSEQDAARLQIETERWQRDREQRDDDRAQTLQQRQRDTLAAPFWAAVRKGQRAAQFGASEAVKVGLDFLEEIETCKDPAHFESKVIARFGQQPDWREKLAAEPAKPITPLQSVLNDFKQIDAYLAGQTPDPKTHAAKPRRRGRQGSPNRPPSRPAQLETHSHPDQSVPLASPPAPPATQSNSTPLLTTLSAAPKVLERVSASRGQSSCASSCSGGPPLSPAVPTNPSPSSPADACSTTDTPPSSPPQEPPPLVRNRA